MPINFPIPDEKKLTVTHRVEAGCLGPEGHSLLVGFCIHSQKEIRHLHSGFINWKIIPRMDKSDPEFEYSLLGRQLNNNQLSRYLALFDITVEQFEAEICDKIGTLIEVYTSKIS